MRRASLVCVLALASGAAQADAPRDLQHAVADCAARGPADTRGLADLEKACPDLGPALDRAGLTTLLTNESSDELTIGTLKSALPLLAPHPAAGTVHLERESLAPILKELAPKSAAPSWWERIRAWLYRHLIATHGESGGNWFFDWVRGLSVPQFLLRMLLWSLFVIIVASAVAVVVHELRAYGVFKRGPRAVRLQARAFGPGWSPALTLADVLAAPASRRAALLFELVVGALAASARRGGLRQRTHRELAREPPFDDAASRQHFVTLAHAAEQQLFSGAPVADAHLEAAVAGGTALYQSVSAAAGTRP